ncbi:bifunctional [glutamine synthetase] adenylyltransferase/[glutamine synthetase]-adenylyl-L-tyrosine phosphorylase [Marisediminicola senii]|uniref:bifunctional [glutamine synthetase] adenylyltransferase/[glutamine synthetase]-adenylyl-L-tyrosine phosphorylase n=1 Tax=Marisediminicola senii TaxID=2711233 RepID=UPI0013ED9348|nr:bifunctional [glutamine synthetase] adenylyltransferase/[glutamine synthetase]-adenylyl-L-tyrosine phosphorylase [Marisediminicola senii]
MQRHLNALTDLAKVGFSDLSASAELLAEVQPAGHDASLLPLFAVAADPDLALRQLRALMESAPAAASAVLTKPDAAGRLLRVLGASTGLGEFLCRHPDQLAALDDTFRTPPSREYYVDDLLSSVGASIDGVATASDEVGWRALRVRYRTQLLRVAAWDLSQPDPLFALDVVARALADLAGAALEAAVAVARASVSFDAAEVAGTRFAIIGMGKAGARELNYVSDVDVIFVAEGSDGVSNARAVEIATRLAMATMRAVHDYSTEPELWEVDANLRPEGKDGALVRTLESHIAYYDRWAKTWEFQAQLKASPLAGDRDLAERYVAAMAPKVWTSAARDNFVESVQKMRERVTANIPAAEIDYQLKLGPGGLRDIEFTIQLLQLVHGQGDESIRQPGTLPALDALAAGGYVGRAEAAEFARDYRFLRLLEHRLQLSRLRRTHLMPNDPDRMRVLARSTGIFANAVELGDAWRRTKLAVRSLHERLFYRPLLNAVAALRDDEILLTSEQAAARLLAIGFRDPKGALAHIQSLTAGVSRRAAIQRHLLPVMLQWFADGADPDYGLLAFRRLSEDLGESYWFLRMLRDSSGAAQRLTSALSSARYVGVLLERLPEAAAWFENERELAPRRREVLLEEARATIARHRDPDAAASALRTARRREVLRMAIAAILGAVDVQQLGRALSDITTVILTGLLELARGADDGIEFAIIAMGRYGGRELGFGSDADVMYVYRATTATPAEAQVRAEATVARIKRYAEDLRLPLDLDIGLRPEGRNGPLVRSLASYEAYYARWSLTWEAQALLRARGAVGDESLQRAFDALADRVRYPEAISDQQVREVKRIKARVESERLPQAADPARHVKLGRGSLSDVEWFVQLIQLQHGARIPGLRTTSTLDALAVATDEGFVSGADAARLRDAWVFASRVRSCMNLWMVRTTDVLPVDRPQLEGIARLMEYPPGSASELEDDYLRKTRLARQVFERRFYGIVPGASQSTG